MGEPIPCRPSVKYLEITLDSGLCFEWHVEAKIMESTAISGMMWSLLAGKSPLPFITKVTLFLMIVRSCEIYASEARWNWQATSRRLSSWNLPKSNLGRRFEIAEDWRTHPLAILDDPS